MLLFKLVFYLSVYTYCVCVKFCNQFLVLFHYSRNGTFEKMVESIFASENEVSCRMSNTNAINTYENKTLKSNKIKREKVLKLIF